MNENERKVVVQRMLLLIAVACIIMGLHQKKQEVLINNYKKK